MNKQKFSAIVKDTKNVVLLAVEKYLAARFSHAIDDVVQETYLRAYKSLVKKKFQGKSKLSTWLYEIAKNESLRMNQKLMREEEKTQKAFAKLQSGRTVAETSSVKVWDDDIERLKFLIANLPVKYRRVFEMVFLGHSEKEIAASLEISCGTVKSRLSRGRELLSRKWNAGA